MLYLLLEGLVQIYHLKNVAVFFAKSCMTHFHPRVENFEENLQAKINSVKHCDFT